MDTFSNEVEREKTGKSRSADELGGKTCDKRGCEWGTGERREMGWGLERAKQKHFETSVFQPRKYSGHVKSLLNFPS